MLAAKEKIRVYALAKTLDVESKLILDHCRELGYDVKNQLSGLEPEQAETVKQRIQKGVKSGATPEPVRAPAGPTLPPKDKPIVKLPVAKPAPAPKPVVAPTPPPIPTPTVPVAEPVTLAPTPTPKPTVPSVVAPPTPVPTIVAPPVAVAPAPTPTPAPASRTVRNIPTTKSSPSVVEAKPVIKPTPVVKPAVAEEVVEPKEVEIPSPVEEVAVPAIAPRVEEVTPTPAPIPEPIVETPSPIQSPVAEEASIPVPTPVAPAPVAAPPAAPKPLPSVGSQRVMNLNGPRPTTSSTRPAATNPTTPATTTPVPVAKTPAPTNPNPTTPARPGTTGPAPTRTSPGTGPTGPGTSGTRPPVGGGGAAGERHRRTDRDRRPGDVAGRRDGGSNTGGQPPRPGQQPPARPGQQPPARGEQKPVQPAKPTAPPPRQFTPEELAELRKGVTVTELIRKQKLQEVKKDPNAPVGPEEQPAEGELDEDGKKRPGKIVGRNDRHKDRAIRQEKRKAKDTVVIKDGHVEIIEDNSGRRMGRRPKPKIKLPGTLERKGKVPITLPISVRSLSAATALKVKDLMFKLKELTNSLFTINSPVDTDLAEMIAEEKGIELEIIRPKDLEEDVIGLHKEAADDSSKLEPRAPVVTIMGHVDHGKTSLLDKIRNKYGMKSDVVSTEAGGITQVIRAWRVEKDGKPVTFLDTPGHEAFTKMRARGANVTDIAVIVVAADDGVMPQTEEAINHAKAANVSIVVAINKIDMPNANIKKTEQQLYGLSLLPDSMGGDCQFVYTSAATGQGIDELLETLSLVAEIKELKANPHKPAHGTCLEAYLSGDEGVMATLLVQEGTLHRGDILICGAAFGRVRAMYDDMGRPLKEAGPSVPVRISGLDEVPNADDHFHVVTELTKAAEIAEKRKERYRESQYNGRVAVKLEDFGKSEIKIGEIKIILKAEAKGSIEAIKKELEKLVHDEVRVRLLHAGIGAISESDVSLALASPEDSMVIGFNVVPDDEALKLAEERKIPLREYNIIYQLTNDIKAALEGKLKPREDVIHLGRAVVRETFKISKTGTIAGCYVTQGVIERSAKIRVIRDGAIIFPPADRNASLESLKRFKDDQREVREGFECGMKVANYDDIKVGDVIEAYRIEQVLRTL